MRAYFENMGLDVDDEPGPQHLNVSVSTGREPFAFEKLPQEPKSELEWTILLEEVIDNLRAQLGVAVKTVKILRPE